MPPEIISLNLTATRPTDVADWTLEELKQTVAAGQLLFIRNGYIDGLSTYQSGKRYRQAVAELRKRQTNPI